jgi:cation diffusion facilitator family transporter
LLQTKSLLNARKNFKVQQLVTVVAVLLFIIKLVAWWMTGSVAILTDALESTVNVVAGFISLFSLFVAAKPRDEDHPYGHGKAEFVSAAVEGSLITVAGLIIIYEAINNFIHPHPLKQLDYGILLVSITAIINYITGTYCIKVGKRNNSLALIASGKHLRSDTWSTIGIIAGLILIYLLHWPWLDSAVAILFAFIIIYTGYSIVRKSLAGIMDETDMELMKKLVSFLQENRRDNWIDLHNVRIIKYGSILHLDCHLTVPWYLNVHEAHEEIDILSQKIKSAFSESVELFVHSDGCLDFSCSICSKADCTFRKVNFVKRVDWTIENITSNSKHKLEVKKD